MKYLTAFGAIALVFSGGFVHAADLDVYKTSFEAEESPFYELARIVPGKPYRGWTILGGGSAGIVTAGEGMVPFHGQQMLRMEREGSAYLSRAIAPDEFPITGNFRFSAVAAFAGELPETEGSPIVLFFLNNWRKESGNFAGAHFGILKEGGEARLFANADITNTSHYATFGSVVQSGSFYRFEVDMDAESRLFTVKVSDAKTGTVVGEFKEGMLKGERPTKEQGFNFFRVLAPNGVEVCLDDLTISTLETTANTP